MSPPGSDKIGIRFPDPRKAKLKADSRAQQTQELLAEIPDKDKELEETIRKAEAMSKNHSSYRPMSSNFSDGANSFQGQRGRGAFRGNNKPMRGAKMSTQNYAAQSGMYSFSKPWSARVQQNFLIFYS